LLYFTPKSRSLSEVENEIFEVEYFIEISVHFLVHFLRCVLSDVISSKNRAIGKQNKTLGYLSPPVIKYI